MTDATATPPSTLRRVGATQLIGSTADGIVLSTAVIFFTTRVGIPESAVGVVLASAAASALVLSVPLGVLADRIGLRRSAVIASIVVALALVLYATASNVATYALGAVFFVVTQAWVGAVRQALVSSSVAENERVRARAILHTLLNGGMGLGTVIGAVVIGLGSRPVFIGAYALGAVGALACALVFVSLPRPATVVSAAKKPGLIALRDRRFVATTALFSIVQVTMPVLGVLLPLWIATRTDAPDWVAPVALGINTVVVLAMQTGWASRVTSDFSARVSALIAAGALLAACGLIGSASIASALVIPGVLALTIGEIAAGAATWHVAFANLPPYAHGQYQATFGMAGSVGRILGPALALPLVLGLGVAGWVVLGMVMAAAASGIAVLSGRR